MRTKANQHVPAGVLCRLAASEDPYGVALGGVLGHALCTMAAVVGGRHLATHINERAVQIFGGILFIVFGVHTLWAGPD